MKKPIKIFITAFILIAIFASIFQFANFQNQNSYALADDYQSAQKQEVKVGYLKNHGVINNINIRGSEGMGYEFFEEIEKHTDFSFKFIEVEWVEVENKLANGEIDLFGTLAKTEEREKQFSLIETSFFFDTASIYASTKTDYFYDDPQGLNGSTIGVLKETVELQALINYVEENEIDVKIKLYNDANYAEYINKGEIDAYVAGGLVKIDDVKIIDKLYVEPQFFISTKEKKALCESINSAVLEIEREDPYFNELLWNKYYGQSNIANQYITQEEKLALEKKQYYNVGYHADLRPISFKDANGEPQGYSIDVMNDIAQNLGIRINYVPLFDDKFNQDIEIDFNLSPFYDESFEQGCFTDSYLEQNMIVIKKDKVKNENVRNILAFDSLTLNTEEILSIFPNAQIHKAKSSTEWRRLDELYSADCFVVSEGTEMLVVDGTRDRLCVLDTKSPAGIWVSNNLPKEVFSAINKSVSALDKSMVNEYVLQNVLNLQSKMGLVEFIDEYEIYIATIIIIVLLAFSLLLFFGRKRVKKILEKDRLTGLMTKYKFSKECKKVLETARPYEYQMVLLDIDKFKSINNIFGTEIGDKILCEIALSAKRQAKNDAIIGRIQNDVFAIFTRNDKDLSIVIDEELEEILKELNIDFPLFFSIGIFIIENPNDEIRSMIDCADIAKSIGKKTFGHTIEHYTKDMKKKIERENYILSSLEWAIEDEEFFILIQPKIQLETSKPIGGEVLLRWQRQDGTIVYPDEFIPLLEENNFITKIDSYVLDKTCQFISSSKIELPKISVNTSITTLLEPNSSKKAMAILGKYRVLPQQIILEITETCLNLHFDKIQKVIKKYKNLGFGIAIDDFGKGASSLARIRDLDIDILKMDKTFLESTATDEKSKYLVHSIITMANGLGISTLAEGVETEQERKMLIEYGCEYAQGYLFDRPLKPHVFLQRIKDSAKKVYAPVLRNKKVSQFMNDNDNLHCGIAVTANDKFSTIIEANSAFYEIIGHTKEEFEQNHQNHLAEILYDKLHTLVNRYLKEGQFNFSYDLRMINSKGEIVWIRAFVEFDPENNLFFITIIDISEQNKHYDSTIAYEDYTFQKEIVQFANMQTSDFIYVTEFDTNKLVYLNQNLIEGYNITCEKEWKGQSFYKLFYGSDEPVNPEFYNNISEEKFAVREKFNQFLNKYFKTQVKLIKVNGKLLRLHISTDISEKIEVENNLKLQNTLLSCVEELYEHEELDKIFSTLLSHILNYYNGDIAYYFEIDENKSIVNVYSETKEGVTDKAKEFELLSNEERIMLVKELVKENKKHFTFEEISQYNLSNNIMKIFVDGKIVNFLLAKIENENHTTMGFIGVGNPSVNKDNTNLIDLLSHFISMIHRNIELKNYEKDILIAEEYSVYSILNKCNNILQAGKNKEDVLSHITTLLREHYGSCFSMILTISHERQKFEVEHQYSENGNEFKFDDKSFAYQNMMQNLAEILKSSSNESGISLVSSDALEGEEKKFWQNEMGVSNAYLSPIYNKENGLSGILVLGNPKLNARSHILLQAVSKFIADFLEKEMLLEDHEEKISQDPYTSIYNKVATERKIKACLNSGILGSMFMIDIDDFKGINDALGHAYGDEVIKNFSKALKKTFRKEDIIGRIGGDEFMAFCPNLVDSEEAKNKAENLMSALNSIYPTDNNTVKITSSIGICIATENCTDFNSLYNKVDETLYKVKNKGKNGVGISY